MFSPRIALAGALSSAAALAFTVTLAIPADAASDPVARDDSYSTATNVNLVVGAPGVLNNDFSAGGQPLTASLVSGAGHGSVSVSGNGAFTYVPTTNYAGPDQFTYQACEPAPAPTVVKPAPASIPVLPPVTTTPAPTSTPLPTTTPAPTSTSTPGQVVLKAMVANCDLATVFINVKGGTTTPGPVGSPAPSFPNCTAAFAAGVSNIPSTDSRYRSYLDRDHDGVACELNGNDGGVVGDNVQYRVINGKKCHQVDGAWVPVTVAAPPTCTACSAPPPVIYQAPQVVAPAPVFVAPAPVYSAPIVPSGPAATGR